MLVYWINRSYNARLGGVNRLDIADVGFLIGTNLAGIVCLEKEASSQELAQILGVSWLHIPMVAGNPPSDAELKQIVDFVHDCEKNGTNRPILFHSESDCSGTILAALLIILDGLPPDLAITRIRAVNPFALNNQADYNFVNTMKPGFLNR
ncbi:MAG: hypothetical protein ACFFE8_14415 [Candidatus Heimdallarchaeota archaeon]